MQRNLPDTVRIVEMGPRDGLQNEQVTVDTATKIELIQRLAAAGLAHIEAGSFVSPKWVPQMAGSDEVFAGLPRNDNVTYSALTPNLHGLERAMACGVRKVAVFAAASESFSRKNINCSIAESLVRFEPVMERALGAGLKVRGYVSCVAGCPYEGAITPDAVKAVTHELLAMGCYEVSLGDTIGVGTPGSINRLLNTLLAEIAVEKLAVHFHDTYGQALANIYAALQLGIRVIDSSVSGLGGCPYAKGASGNVATEDVVYMLNGLSIEHGIDLDKLMDAGSFIMAKLGRRSGSRVAQAMGRY